MYLNRSLLDIRQCIGREDSTNTPLLTIKASTRARRRCNDRVTDLCHARKTELWFFGHSSSRKGVCECNDYRATTRSDGWIAVG